ncbi:MAG TPA: GntR family transcriptional regulator [Polyangiaceae bacterium]|nr:GntR family transcriptional regulator [Polyangiaceae bacterium]
MLIRVQPQDPTPLYTQIAGQVRRAVMEGRVKPGERLPGARELADALQVHMHTVLRAYDELRQEGLVEVRRGRGVVVLANGPDRSRLLELARALRAEGARQGLALRELRKLLGEVG